MTPAWDNWIRRQCARYGVTGSAVRLMILNSRAGQPADPLFRLLIDRAEGRLSYSGVEKLASCINDIRNRKPYPNLMRGLDMSREARKARASEESDKWYERTNYMAQATY